MGLLLRSVRLPISATAAGVTPLAEVPTARTLEEARLVRSHVSTPFLPGVVPFVAPTEAAAWAVEREANEARAPWWPGVALRHRLVIGTADQVAEELACWYAAGAVDGYHLIPPPTPHGLAPFAESVPPLLAHLARWSRAG